MSAVISACFSRRAFAMALCLFLSSSIYAEEGSPVVTITSATYNAGTGN